MRGDKKRLTIVYHVRLVTVSWRGSLSATTWTTRSVWRGRPWWPGWASPRRTSRPASTASLTSSRGSPLSGRGWWRWWGTRGGYSPGSCSCRRRLWLVSISPGSLLPNSVYCNAINYSKSLPASLLMVKWVLTAGVDCRIFSCKVQSIALCNWRTTLWIRMSSRQ